MWRAEGKAVVHKCGVDHDALFRSLQQVTEITQMPVAAAHAVSRTVLV